ncbi:hypothetical protein HJC23_010336 [Cyclotella cryptica]|uniref:Uncharacterized protein n=1 Tax=Cyclotella cryptica TaxID=29204 RepID=A0ABD3QP86_9STRA
MRFPSAINSIVKSLCPTPLFLAGTAKSASYSGSRRERTPPLLLPGAYRQEIDHQAKRQISLMSLGVLRGIARAQYLQFQSLSPWLKRCQNLSSRIPLKTPRRLMFLAQNSFLSLLLLPVALVPLNLPGRPVEGSNYSTPKKTGSDDEVPSSSSSDESVPKNTPRSLISFEDVEEYDGTYAAEEFSVHQRIMHFLRGCKIDQRTTTVAVRNRMMLERYHNLLCGFSSSDFARPSLATEMTQCLYNAKKDMTGDRLWKKFEDWRKELRTEYFPKLPKNLATIPSGHQLMDVYKLFVIHRFREEYEAQCEGLSDEEIVQHVPEDYWLKGANTRCLLVVMVHRLNKEVVTICSTLNPGQTRENQRRNAAARVQTECEETSVALVKSQNDLVSSQLRLYQENKDSFISIMGEEKYHETIMSLLKKLPDPDVLRTLQTEENANRRSEIGATSSEDDE